MDDRHTETRRAIAVMTAWADESGETEFSVEQIMHAIRTEPHGEVRLIIGLTNLLGLVLAEHREQSGQAPADLLQTIALAISAE